MKSSECFLAYSKRIALNRQKESIMTEEKKTIDSEVLEKVDGGLAAFRVLKQDVQAMIPDEVKEKLSTAKSDLEACRILMDHGVDLTAIEKKIDEAGFGPIKIGQQELSDDALANAAGGFFPISTGTDVVCKCGARYKEDFTLQAFIALTGTSKYIFIFRCNKCGQLIGYTRDGKVEYIDLSLPLGL